MAKFCTVAPVQVLEGLMDHAREIFGSNHLLLAHDVVKPGNKERYRDLFSEFFCRKPDEHIILDNSVVELGGAVSLDIVAEAAFTVLPTLVVLPDVMTDGEATLYSSLNAIEPWQKALPPHTQLMVIPQGKTLNEFVRCAEGFALAEAPFDWWGCPRNLVKWTGTREKALRLLGAILPKPIHMFGFSDRITDDVMCARDPSLNVVSIDSAVPLRLQMEISLTSYLGPRGDWWETGTCTVQTIKNLERARQWFAM